MEISETISSNSSSTNPVRLRFHRAASNFIRAPLLALLEYSGVIHTQSVSNSGHQMQQTLIEDPTLDYRGPRRSEEVSIRIMGGGEEEFLSGVAGVGSGAVEEQSLPSTPIADSTSEGTPRESGTGVGGNDVEPSNYRYDIQQVAQWIEQILPFSLLLLVVLIRQHLQDTMARQAAMILKCLLLMYYKNTGGHNYRKQGQMLTLVEYVLLLYRTLLPTPVWYRFFLNKEYGSIFSSVTTGLYLTFKLTTVVQKVQMLCAALRALSCKEVQYGSSATTEQVNAAGDLCAICQEKMHSPIMLSCRHIFCEDCVSEWFDRERTCPLCRAVIKAADIRSFADGSTSLLFQFF